MSYEREAQKLLILINQNVRSSKPVLLHEVARFLEDVVADNEAEYFEDELQSTYGEYDDEIETIGLDGVE